MNCCCDEKGLGAQEAHKNLWTAFYNRYKFILRRVASLFSDAFYFQGDLVTLLMWILYQLSLFTSPIQGSILLSRIMKVFTIRNKNREGR